MQLYRMYKCICEMHLNGTYISWYRPFGSFDYRYSVVEIQNAPLSFKKGWVGLGKKKKKKTDNKPESGF